MAFQYTFRSDDIESFDASTRDLLENRDRELELYTSTIDTSFLNLNASNLASGTVPSSRVTGAYTGITQVGTLTAGVASYSIGDTGPAGGKVFITPSTSGNTSGLYFEIAPVSAEVRTTWAQFAPINYTDTSVPLAQFNNIGTGKSNTVAIVNQGNSNTDTCAAKYCDAFTYGGFSDWFLPSQNELNQIYVNRVVLGNNFNSSFYWSSSQSSSPGGAWAQEFGAGSQSNNNKINTHYVRPVRSFSTIGLNVLGSAVVRTAATQDGVLLTGRAGGTSDYVVSILPTTLNGNRTVTLPDVTGTMITTGNLSSITSVGTLSSLNVSGTISNLNGRMELGLGRVSSGNAYVDLIGDTTYSDYGLRLIRYETGANTPSELIHRGTGSLSIIARESAKIIFSTENNLRMIIDSAGNVGIGNNEPSRHGLLAVGASILASTTKNMIAMYSDAGGDATTMRIAGYAYTGNARTAIDFVQNGTSNFNSQMVFSTSAGAGAVERMRIDSAGNVGIGVTSPSAKLDIIGNQIIRAAATQDGIQLAGRAGGTGSATVTLTPAALTTNRTITLPNVDGTAITTGNLSSITSVGTLSTPLAFSVGSGAVIKAIENRLVSGSFQSAAMYFGDGASGGTATGGIEASWDTANTNPIIGIGVTRDSRGTKITMDYAGVLRFFSIGTEKLSITSTQASFANNVTAPRFDVGGSYFNTTPQISGQGIAYTGATVGGGTANLMGIRWASPNIVGTVDNAVSAVLGTVSDRRFKTNIETLQIGLATVKQLRPVTYNPLDVIGFDENNQIIIGDKDPYETVEGFIADEVEQVAPWLVQGGENGGYQSVNYALITPMLVKAVQELDQRLQQLETV